MCPGVDGKVLGGRVGDQLEEEGGVGDDFCVEGMCEKKGAKQETRRVSACRRKGTRREGSEGRNERRPMRKWVAEMDSVER